MCDVVILLLATMPSRSRAQISETAASPLLRRIAQQIGLAFGLDIDKDVIPLISP